MVTEVELFESTNTKALRMVRKNKDKLFFHIRTVHLDIIKVLFIHQLMYQ